jgi:hypothetical protein
MEWIAEKCANPVPERHGFRRGTQVPHGPVTLGAQPMLFAMVRIGHAAGTEVNLAFATMPFCGIAWVIMAVVFHIGSGLYRSREYWL